jgi:hypothetical protein
LSSTLTPYEIDFVKSIYENWIANNVNDGYGRCLEITAAMAAAFPELVRVRGHYYDYLWGKRQHWWLTDGDEIVDPTAAQFPSKGCGVYTPWPEGAPEPTGICPNCGEPVYSGTCCSDECSRAYAAFCSE